MESVGNRYFSEESLSAEYSRIKNNESFNNFTTMKNKLRQAEIDYKNKFFCPIHNIRYPNEVYKIDTYFYAEIFTPNGVKIPCPECKEEAQRKKELEEKKENFYSCRRYTDNENHFLYKADYIPLPPERVRNASFDSFDLQSGTSSFHSRMEAMEACKELIYGKKEKVILLGSYGIGKTYLASSLLNETLDGFYFTESKLYSLYCNAIQNGFTKERFINQVTNSRYLVIDEIGDSNKTDAFISFQKDLYSEIHEKKCHALLIGNLLIKEKCIKKDRCDNCGKCLEANFDRKILSRFAENSKVVIMTSEFDYRRK